MESSQFTIGNSPEFSGMEPINTQGGTCDAFRVKIYGKLHFLKRLKAEHAGDIRYQEALRKEFETGFRLEHPHLVRYVSLNGDSILMEYVDGETLAQRLATNPAYFSRKNTDKLIRQLLDVVGFLHSHQVLHLDLKPDNIMLTRIGNDVKLVDLGCCLTDTFADTPGRTPAFAAPEQLPSHHRGGAGVGFDTRTDIYAIGRILQLLPHPNIYNNVLARCTAEDPSRRYASADELSCALKAATRHRWLWLLLPLLPIVLVLAMLPWHGKHEVMKQTQPLPATQQQKTTEAPNSLPPAPITKQTAPPRDSVTIDERKEDAISTDKSKEHAEAANTTIESATRLTPEPASVPWNSVERALLHSIDSLAAITIFVKADVPIAYDWYATRRRFDSMADNLILRYRATYPQHATKILSKGAAYFSLLSDSIFNHRKKLQHKP